MEWVPVLAYLLVLGGFTALGAPIATLVFRALPRKGAAFALPTALVPFTLTVFWVGHYTFGLHALGFGVAVVLVGTVAATRTDASPEWRSVAAMYGVFAVGFLVMVAVRAADPGVDPVGGEQFLHFGLVSAIERTNSLPPEDVWFAGRPLRYYYGTQLQVTSLSMLTGTPVRYGFNLGIATFYGLLFVVAYGVGGAVVRRQGHPYRLGGIGGTFFLALSGPTTTPVRLVAPYAPDVVAEPLERAAFGFAADRFYGGDLSRAVSELSAPLEWSWWHARYVVPGTLQEVPLYSFVKADLHGHTFATGYVLFAGALAFAYYATPVEARVRRAGIVLGGLGAVAGLFGFMNTWSLPTVAGLAVLTVAAADAHPATMLPGPIAGRVRLSTPASLDDRLAWLARELWRVVLAAIAGVVVLFVGLVVASPFLVVGSIPKNDGVGLFPPRSPLGPFLVVYAGLLTVFALSVATHLRPVVSGVPAWRLGVGSLATVVSMAVTTLVFDFGVLAALAPPVVAGWLLVRSDVSDFSLVLLVAGAGLLLSLEVIHARLPLVDNPRWNTSLKVTVQGWTLGAAGAGAATVVLLARGAERLGLRNPWHATNGGHDDNETASAETTTPRPRSDRRYAVSSGESVPGTAAGLRSLVVVSLLVTVVVASAVFPVMVLGDAFAAEVVKGRYDASLDGLEYAAQNHSDEYDALRWLRDQPGRPTVVEAPGDSYSWTSPAATISGVPGVVGWDHQAEYRGADAYERRVTHVDTIFAGEWPDAARHLARYNVTYVYVGPNERRRYGDQLRSFDRGAFTVAFESENVTIHQVDQSALPHSEHRPDRTCKRGGG